MKYFINAQKAVTPVGRKLTLTCFGPNSSFVEEVYEAYKANKARIIGLLVYLFHLSLINYSLGSFLKKPSMLDITGLEKVVSNSRKQHVNFCSFDWFPSSTIVHSRKQISKTHYQN